MPVLLIVFMLMLVSRTSDADIYRYVNEEGVECFTDAPTTARASVVMKEPGKKRPRAASRKASPSPPNETAERKAPSLITNNNETSPSFTMPVDGFISSWVGIRRDPFDGTLRQHEGVDIAIPMGTPVRAAAPGVVVFSGFREGYGNTVMISHRNGMLSLYAHNSANLCTRGDTVDERSIVALSGSTGRSTGPHLHFEAWKDGVNITEALVGPWGKSSALARSHLPGDGIRREVQADGTLRFTNLP